MILAPALFFALSSGLSEGLATAFGFLLGRIARKLIMDYDHWVAFALLLAVGGHMCWSAYLEHRDGKEQEEELRVHGPLRILFVSAITSIDSLGVGVSLGILNKPIGLYSTAIGVGAFVSTYFGLFLARRLSGGPGQQGRAARRSCADRTGDQDAVNLTDLRTGIALFLLSRKHRRSPWRVIVS